MRRYRVYVGLVGTGYFDEDQLNRTIREGMVYCGVTHFNETSQSPVAIKASAQAAHPRLARYAYTHPEVLRAVANQVLSFSPTSQLQLLVDENRLGLPVSEILRRATGQSDTFRESGYYALEHLFRGHLKVAPSSTLPQARYQLSKGDLLSSSPDDLVGRSCNEIIAPRLYSEMDCAVYCPKIHNDVLTDGFSGAVHLGWQGLAEDNNHRIGDWLEICNPRLIVSDGIVAAIGGNHATQRGHELGVVLISNNAVAHDWVATQILNLDANKIRHLRVAMERGWGPQHLNEIEIGGAGMDGVRQLSQKSKYWDMALLPIQRFPERFNRENPGFTFPLEICTGLPYEPSGTHGILLDWFYSNYDFPNRRESMGRWPKATVCAGYVKTYPQNTLVYALGDDAITALDQMTSSYRQWLDRKRIKVRTVQLKNGSRHWLILVPTSPSFDSGVLSYWSLGLAFLLGSFGRTTSPLFRLFRFRRGRKRVREKLPVIITSRLAHNAWWSLRAGSLEVSGLYGARSTSINVAE